MIGRAAVVALAGVLAVAAACGDAPLAGDPEIRIGSTEPGGGALIATLPAASIPVRLERTIGGFRFYTAPLPAFALSAGGNDVPHALSPGTAVQLELTRAGDGAEVQVGDTILVVPGQSATIGVAPEVLAQPTWILVVAADAAVVPRPLSFRLRSSSPAYAPSAAIEVVLAPE